MTFVVKILLRVKKCTVSEIVIFLLDYDAESSQISICFDLFTAIVMRGDVMH